MNHLRVSAARVLALVGACGLVMALGVSPAAADTASFRPPAAEATRSRRCDASEKVAGTFEIDAEAGTLTYMVSFQGSEPAAAGHIHEAVAGSNGDVVVPLDAAVINAGGSATVTADKALLADIVADPAGYYLNVHTATHPGGAARGQLMSGAGTAPTAVAAGTGGQFAALNSGSAAPMVILLVGAVCWSSVEWVRSRAGRRRG